MSITNKDNRINYVGLCRISNATLTHKQLFKHERFPTNFKNRTKLRKLHRCYLSFNYTVSLSKGKTLPLINSTNFFSITQKFRK